LEMDELRHLYVQHTGAGTRYENFLLEWKLLEIIVENSGMKNVRFKLVDLLPHFSAWRRFCIVDQTIIHRLSRNTGSIDVLFAPFIEKCNLKQERWKSDVIMTSDKDRAIAMRNPEHLSLQKHYILRTNAIENYIMLETLKFSETDLTSCTEATAPPRKRVRSVKKHKKDFVRHNGLESSSSGQFSTAALHNLPENTVFPRHVVAIDPGHCNPYTAYTEHYPPVVDDSVRFHSLKRGTYYWDNGCTQSRRRPASYFTSQKFRKNLERKPNQKYRKLRRGMVPDDIQVAERVLSMNSLRVSDYTTYLIHLKEVSKQWKFLQRTYGSRNRARNEIFKKSKKDKTMHAIAKELIPDLHSTTIRSTMIAYGNGFDDNTPWKRIQYGAAPVKYLKRYLANICPVVIIDEAYTTKKCHFCQSDMEKVQVMRTLPNLKPNETRKQWKIRKKLTPKAQRVTTNPELYKYVPANFRSFMRCTDPQCHELMKLRSRDQNAAQNILTVFEEEWRNRRRPPYLMPPPTVTVLAPPPTATFTMITRSRSRSNHSTIL